MNKKISLVTWVIITLFLTIGACYKKTEPLILKDALPGTWDFESLKLDTTEHLGSTVQSAFVRFEPLTGNNGNFHQEVAFKNSGIDVLIGTYELLDTPNTVKMVAGEKTNTVTINIGPKDKFIWEGLQEDKKVIVTAKRRK